MKAKIPAFLILVVMLHCTYVVSKSKIIKPQAFVDTRTGINSITDPSDGSKVDILVRGPGGKPILPQPHPGRR